MLRENDVGVHELWGQAGHTLHAVVYGFSRAGPSAPDRGMGLFVLSITVLSRIIDFALVAVVSAITVN